MDYKNLIQKEHLGSLVCFMIHGSDTLTETAELPISYTPVRDCIHVTNVTIPSLITFFNESQIKVMGKF